MILDDILAATRERVRALEGRDFSIPPPEPRSLAGAISRAKGRNAIIAEVKFASPSKGEIRAPSSPEQLAGDFVSGGCCALSVLTEPRFFGGSPESLVRVRDAVEVPVLRKDFIIDPVQLDETASLGADAVLLIASVLGDRLPMFVNRAMALGIEPLVEVYTRGEAGAALRTGANLIGVNNRDLRTMEADLATTLALGPVLRRAGRTVISASGILTPGHIRMLRPACDAFLIGTSLMESADPVKSLEVFVRA
ncbi:MAG TPA: indole-3-glycerol-phosphate synthase [Methanomicrobiales archaeon]|jgi:indole-3-glycerol phosphate synthase|nr:indole-3-glycerol-phosphate synthase [Methanomicrobiales archaeon]